MTAGSLSKTAHRVDHCPEANNLSAWKKASIRINCSEYSEHYSLKIIKKRLLYHCLPSTFLNETIEFCGPNTAIEKGMWGGGGFVCGYLSACGRVRVRHKIGFADQYYSKTFHDMFRFNECIFIPDHVRAINVLPVL